MENSIKQPSSVRHDFSFSGTASEYFGIWIVNLLLSIVTLGIYTAWAKVRRLRYFYGNTWLDSHNFDYHARPMQILIGRIIVVGVLIIFNVLAEFYPFVALALFIPYIFGLPWLINKAIAFNARMTSYRNVRFGFSGSYTKALWVFAILPLAVPLVFTVIGAVYFYSNQIALQTMGFEAASTILWLIGFGLVAQLALIPYISKQSNTYIANNTKFGTAEFSADMPLKSLFHNLGATLLICLVPALLIAGIVSSIFKSGAGAGSASSIQFGVILFYFMIIVGFLFYAAGVRNIAFNATTLQGEHQLESGLPRFGYAWVIVSNLFASALSIGLLIPWAAIRSWRYIADHTSMRSNSELNQFVADQEALGNVAAAEYLDIDGIDFGL